jgi:chemotaxis protein histidine kinase CheA
MVTESKHVQEALVGEFAAETLESLSALAQERLTLRENPGDVVASGTLFRLVHTIRGTCGFLGLLRLEKLAQATEEALDKLRDKKTEASLPAVGLVLLALDRITAMLDYLSQNGQEEDHDDSALINQLIQLVDTGTIDNAVKKTARNKQNLSSFLLFAAGSGAPKAVLLESVERLEKIEVKTIEIAGDSPAVLYRGVMMPLITLDDTLTLPDRGLAQIILFSRDNKTIGLVVEEILDIVLADVKLGGSIVISGKMIDIVDSAQLHCRMTESPRVNS